MNSLNIAAAKVTHRHQNHLNSPHHRPSFFSRPISSISFRTARSPPLSSSILLVKASSSSFSNPENPKEKPQSLKHLKTQTPSPFPFQSPFSLLKSTVIATVTATALFCFKFHFAVKHSFASPISTSPVVETVPNDTVSEEDREKTLEDHVNSHPDDVEALRNLMEIRIKSKKITEAISVIERLIELEPNETEWPLLKSHLCIYLGDVELAKKGFSEILSNDPFRVEAYHGLVMAASESGSKEELKEVEAKIEEAVKKCKKENKKSEWRDFKLLLAQIRVLDGKYDEALKVYQDLVKEEPRDFRPYLCQGIIFTLLRKKDEAEKNFEKYRRLVPKGHPYASYFDDNMMATKIFAQKVESEMAASKS